jgi:hypothetical protein
MEMIWNEKLNQLRTLVATECDARMRKDHQLSLVDVAEWLLGHHRQAVLEGLEDLVSQVMEQWDDDHRAKRLLRVRPDLVPEQWETGIRSMRENAELLGVPLCYLLQLDAEKCQQCLEVVCFIARLRADESAASISKGAVELYWAAEACANAETDSQLRSTL